MTEIFQIIGMTFSCFLALVLIRKRRNLLFGIAFMCCGLILFEKYVWQIGYMDSVPFLAEVFVPLSFSIPALLYLGAGKSFKSVWVWLLWGIPILPYLNFVPLYASSLAFKSCYVQYEIQDSLSEHCMSIIAYAPTLINDSLLDLLFLLECGILVFLLRIDKSELTIRKAILKKPSFKNWNNIIVGIITFAGICVVVDVALMPESLSLNSYFIPAIGILTTVLLIDNTSLLNSVTASKVYSNITDQEVIDLFHKIKHTLLHGMRYADNNLTMIKLSQEMEISSNKLSYVLNANDSSFKQLVNSIRIQKATDLMLTSKIENYSIDGIAQMVGYKSKSTFYQNFKKLHGKTPRVFLKEYQNRTKT